jgi:predicted glycosyltransferase
MSVLGNGPVWFDLDNTPHVLFLEPLMHRLGLDGLEYIATSRAQAQTVDLAAHRGIPVEVIGRGDRRGIAGKVFGIVSRAAYLDAWARRNRPTLLVSCSRSAALVARKRGLASVGLLDYEHAEQRVLALASESIWMPDILENADLPAQTRKVARFYPGLKENLYLDDWQLEPAACRELLDVSGQSTVVVARPPAETAHYASDLSSALWLEAIRGIAVRENVQVLVTARTGLQRKGLATRLRDLPNVTFLERTVDGPALVRAADLVIGGGGTMNREAAVLGVPVWSVFTGPTAAIDEQLAREGRLRWLGSHTDVRAALKEEVPKRMDRRGPFREGLERIYDHIASLLPQ